MISFISKIKTKMGGGFVGIHFCREYELFLLENTFQMQLWLRVNIDENSKNHYLHKYNAILQES